MADKSRSPTEQEWRALYEAAGAFKQLAPWEWMLDSDVFGVRNPETGQIGYCCVMGNLGQHFALGVYLGDEGFRGYLRLQVGEYWPPDTGALYIQHCLSASFEDRAMLSKQDRDQIKALGLKYRGRNAWPVFRNYTPGYFPWYLSGAEARFLTLALHQTCGVAERFRADEGLLSPPGVGQILVRANEQGAWRDAWYAPDVAEPPLPPPPVDEVRLRRLRQMEWQRLDTWEGDCFYSSQPVQERQGGRPYYPMVGMFVDKRTGFVLPPMLGGPENWRAEFQNHLLTTIEQVHAAPRQIAVRSRELHDLLVPVAEPLGIKLRVASQIPALDEARSSMLAMMGQI